MPNVIYDIGLYDQFSGQSNGQSGGKMYVALTGTRRKATLTDPNNSYAPLANPVSFVGGHVKFAITEITGQAAPPVIDIYGITPTGQWFLKQGVTPGNPTELNFNSNSREEVAVIPFSISDTTAAAETDTGFDLPVGALVWAPIIVDAVTAQAGQTINVGLLSTQTGGNAAGFVSAISLAAAGRVKATINGASPTTGVLLTTTSGAGSTSVNEAGLIKLATRVTYTLSAGTTSTDGFITIPYSTSL